MADAAVSFLLENLKEYLSEIVNLQSNLKERIKGMDEILTFLQSGVSNRQGGQISHGMILQGRHIRDIRYEFQNVKDRFNEVVAFRGRFLGLFKGGFFRAIEELREIGLDIEGIQNRINLLESAIDEARVPGSTVIDQTPNDRLLESFVGRKEELSKLRSLLFDNHPTRHQVIAICGTCGLGKTTLCWKLFSDAKAGGHFDAFVWVNVSDRFQASDILQSIYNQIQVEGRRITEMTEADQAWEIIKIQRRKKCLFVLDGLWSSDSWQSLRSLFLSTTDTNTKVLITTRVREAVKNVGGAMIHDLRAFTEKEACDLILTTVGTNSRDYEQVSRNIASSGEDIIKCWEGLPLVVTESFELALGHSPDEWSHELFVAKMQEIGLKRSILQNSGLSFDSLPHFLIPCYLYLWVLQGNDSRIDAEKLYLSLLAEKFISEKHQEREETLMNVAERYLDDLVGSGMIEVQEAEVPSLTRISSCRLNPLMQQLCRAKNYELGFSKVMGDVQHQPQAQNWTRMHSSLPQGTKPYRVLINLDRWDEVRNGWKLEEESKHIRGMLLHLENSDRFVKWPKELRALFRFKYLKVLSFTGFSFCNAIKLPEGVATLSRLRCLSFNGCHQLPRLPSSIKKLQLLEILDLRVNNKMIIPNILRKLKKLKHLYFPGSFATQGEDKLQLDGLNELETIVNMNTQLVDVENLDKLPHLCYINATIHGSLDDAISISKCMKMDATPHLFKASINICDFDCYTDERRSVLRKIMGYKSLIILRMSGYMHRLPLEDGGLIMGSNLVELDLISSELVEESMETLESLPNLRVLVLKDEAFTGKKLRCSKDGFLELRRLELWNLGKLEKLDVDDKGMPKLCNLRRVNCVKLTDLGSLVGRSSLKVNNCV